MPARGRRVKTEDLMVVDVRLESICLGGSRTSRRLASDVESDKNERKQHYGLQKRVTEVPKTMGEET
jgi:hypothetical protein